MTSRRPVALPFLVVYFVLGILTLIAFRVNAGPGQPAPPTSTPPTTFRPAAAPLGEIWCFLPCASSDNPRGRWSEPAAVTKPGGVAKLASDHALRFYEQGWRRFYVDCPFGKDTDSKGSPLFTFFGALRTPPDSPWRRDFEASWRRVTALPGVKVMAYLGNPFIDGEFRAAAEGGERDLRRAMEMIRLAIEPLKRAGFQAIAIDASEDTDEHHWMGELLKLLELMGFEVLIEPTPRAGKAWLTRFGTIRTTWFHRSLNSFPDAHDFVDPTSCRGERIELYNGAAWDEDLDGRPFKDWAEVWVKRTLQMGQRPSFAPFGVDLEGINVGPVSAPAELER